MYTHIESLTLNSSNHQSPPTVATPTTTGTLPQLSTKTWPPPPPPPTATSATATKPTFHHLTTFPPDHHTTMLGLHNILLIAPSPSACHQNQPLAISSHGHHNIHHDYNNSTNNSNSLNESSFWSLKRRHECSNKDVGEDDSFMKVCRDCGNRAKKECSFRRCRTCCKSRGYDCATHVRSTWIPTAKRREKKLTVVGGCSGGGGGGGGEGGGVGSSDSSSCGVKRPRLIVSSENATATTSTSFNAGPSLSFTGTVHQDPNFKKSLPGQVKATADFKCISVTAINDGEAEVAYVATVNISGHVFKGFLYDQGIDEKNLFPCISKRHMEASTCGKNRDSSSPPILDPLNAYAASAN